jgi:hypothetical protein
MLKPERHIMTDSHPIIVSQSLADRYKSNVVFEFSRYVYRPQQLFDERITFNISSSELTEGCFKQLLHDLGSDEELAFHSKLKIKGKTHHVPMIDFAVENWSGQVWNELRKYIERRILNELFVFSSGRSFHAYSTALMSPAQWREFMGRLLLVNSPGKAAIVDSRWIGHRLIGGYCSLRWSCNTEYYTSYPTKINPVLNSA